MGGCQLCLPEVLLRYRDLPKIIGPVPDFFRPTDSLEEERARFFDSFRKGEQPAYVIGATNNTGGDFDEVTREAYIALRMEGRRALLGQWVDPDGRRFRDTIFVVSGIDRSEALTYKTCTTTKRYWK